MGLPNIGGKFVRKRVRRKAHRTKGRRLSRRKVLGKSGSALAHVKKKTSSGAGENVRRTARNAIIAGTDPLR